MTEFVYNNETQAFINCSLFFTLYRYHLKVKYDVRNDTHKKKVPAAIE